MFKESMHNKESQTEQRGRRICEAGKEGQFTEAWMTVKNRWDGAAEDYFVDEMLQERERGGWEGVVG